MSAPLTPPPCTCGRPLSGSTARTLTVGGRTYDNQPPACARCLCAALDIEEPTRFTWPSLTGYVPC